MEQIYEKEEWKDIYGYENKYQISNIGRVRSLEYHNAKGVRRIGILKPSIDGKGYLRCALSKNNILTTFKVHRLVAGHFIPNPSNLPQVNHKNGIKTDNRVENLEWCDNSTNQIHAYKNGLNKSHYARFRPVEMFDVQNKIKIQFKSIKDASKMIGVSSSTLYNHINGKYLCRKIDNIYKFKLLCK